MMFTEEMMIDVINGLCNIFRADISQIILYGSVARKESNEESDIDIAIILKQGKAFDKRDLFLSWNSEIDMKYDRVFSIVDIEKDQFDKWGNILPFYKNIQKEGIVLWKAA